MTKKLFKGIFFTSILTMLSCLVLIIGVLYGYYDNRLKVELAEKANYLSCGVNAGGEEYLSTIHSETDRVTLIKNDGTVLFDNRAEAKSMKNHKDRTEIKEALKSGIGQSSRFSDTLSEKTYYYAVKLQNGDVLRVSSDRYTVWSLLLSVLQPICIIILFIVVLSVFLSSSVSRRILKPINEIDPQNPNIDEDYPEIAPLIEKIYSQNKKIERQMKDLKKREQEFKVISDNMSEGLLIVDRRGDILSYNNSIAAFFRIETDIKGQNALVLNRSESFRKALDAVLSGNHADELYRLHDRYFELIANPVLKSDGTAKGGVILVVDVTEREAREKLRHEFTSNVSHELKTPLTSIYGISDMLSSGMVKPEDVRTFAGDIHTEADRLIHLVEDIIELSRLDEDSVPKETESVDLYDLSKEAMHSLKPVAAEKNVTLELCGEHLSLNGTKKILYEMVYNLLDNAIKYNKPGGDVKVELSKNAGETVLKVSDTGIGMAQEHLSRIFERFYRIDKSHSKKIGGTGLGLSIVKHAVQYHDGEISVQSTPGEGTTFTVTFKKPMGEL